MQTTHDDRSIGQLLGSGWGDATQLIHQEVLRAGPRSRATVHVDRGPGLDGGRALVTFAGVVILLGAAVDGLIDMDVEPWLPT